MADKRQDGTLVYYVGGYYEYSVNGSETHTTRYYGSEAMRVDNELRYILSDHLGSTSVVTDGSGNYLAEQRYDAWGLTRYSDGTIPTDKEYTGQRHSRDVSLYDYKARWYDPLLGRFLMEDTIIPPQGVMKLDGYAAMLNNPVRFSDPTGNMVPCEQGDVCRHVYSKNPKRIKSTLPIQQKDPEYVPVTLPIFTVLPISNPDYIQFYGNTEWAYLNGKSVRYDRFAQGMHSGLDLFVDDSRGAVPIYAGTYGVVINLCETGCLYYLPGWVEIKHVDENGVVTKIKYGHVDNIQVQIGEQVTPTTLIGYTDSYQDHLHIELIRVDEDGYYMPNPVNYFEPNLRNELRSIAENQLKGLNPYTRKPFTESEKNRVRFHGKKWQYFTDQPLLRRIPGWIYEDEPLP